MMDVEKHVNRKRLELLLQPGYSHDEMQQQLEALSVQDVQSFRAQLLSQCHIEALMEGNITEEQAVTIMRCDALAVTRLDLHPESFRISPVYLSPRNPSAFSFRNFLGVPPSAAAPPLASCAQYEIHAALAGLYQS
jgi:secreted Zn-dependent insulinase-like peptidase